MLYSSNDAKVVEKKQERRKYPGIRWLQRPSNSDQKTMMIMDREIPSAIKPLAELLFTGMGKVWLYACTGRFVYQALNRNGTTVGPTSFRESTTKNLMAGHCQQFNCGKVAKRRVM